MVEFDRWLRREDTWLARGLKNINPREGKAYRASPAKRATEFWLTLPMATLASVPTAVFLLACSLQSPVGQPLYRQERKKTRDKSILITKFRTMVMDADKKPDALLRETAEYSPEDDPRNTKLGKLLRILEFDEFPQLYEVLLGKLSLVDIRSMATEDFKVVERYRPKIYPAWEKAYFEGKPGVFSLNSALNINRKHVLKRQLFDLFYASHASLGLDLYILYRIGLRMGMKALQKVTGVKGRAIV